MKIIISLSSFLFSTFLLIGQNDGSCPRPVLSAKFTPTSLVNFNLPTLLGGVEVRPFPKFGLQLEYGYKSFLLVRKTGNPEGKLDWKYARYKAGMRYYFYEGAEVLAYVGLDAIYVPQRYRRENDYVQLKDGRIFNYERSDIKRTFFSSVITLGVQYVMKNQFFLEFYGGLGTKVRTIAHNFDGSAATEVSALPFSEFFFQVDRLEGTTRSPHVDLGLKIGYIFVKK